MTKKNNDEININVKPVNGVYFYGDYVLIKRQGLYKLISKILKPEFESIIDKEYPLVECEAAIIEMVKNEKLFARIFGQLNLISINPDDIIKKVEPSDYDIINKSLQPPKKTTSRTTFAGTLGVLASLLTIVYYLFPSEILSQKIIIPNVFIVLLVIWSQVIAFVVGSRFAEKDKRYMKDLMIFEQKYKK